MSNTEQKLAPLTEDQIEEFKKRAAAYQESGVRFHPDAVMELLQHIAYLEQEKAKWAETHRILSAESYHFHELLKHLNEFDSHIDLDCGFEEGEGGIENVSNLNECMERLNGARRDADNWAREAKRGPYFE